MGAVGLAKSTRAKGTYPERGRGLGRINDWGDRKDGNDRLEGKRSVVRARQEPSGKS